MIVIGKISGKNQITLPTEVREALSVGVGDRVVFRIEDDGKVSVEGVREVESSKVFGMLSNEKTEEEQSLNSR